MTELIYTINEDGSLTGLYNDLLVGLGDLEINRASNVEFDSTIQKWVVTLILPFSACLIKTFETRSEALEAEVMFINDWISLIY